MYPPPPYKCNFLSGHLKQSFFIPEIIHVHFFHIKQLEGGQVMTGQGEKVHYSLVHRAGFVVQT